MITELPKDLLTAEEQFTNSLIASLNKSISKRIAIQLKLEGIKLMPLSFRLLICLIQNKYKACILFSDAGSTALAKRDYPELKDNIFSYSDIFNNELSKDYLIYLCVSPQPYDFDEFEKITNTLNNTIVMINGKLEDTAVGIGMVARDRRRGFLSSWHYSYWLEPISKGAILRAYPTDWQIFKSTSEGYLYVHTFKSRPDSDSIAEYI